jgi:hypothetical protein
LVRRFYLIKEEKDKSASTGGEIHFIYTECCASKWLNEDNNCDEPEAKRVSKLEALKPLYLIRE